MEDKRKTRDALVELYHMYDLSLCKRTLSSSKRIEEPTFSGFIAWLMEDQYNERQERKMREEKEELEETYV